MFCHPTLAWSWCFAIAHVCYPTLILNIIVRFDVLSSVLLMFHHLYHDYLVILKSMFRHRTFAWSWCFAIAHVCYPTLILNIIVRCDVLSSGLLIFRHLCHVTFLSLSQCFTMAHVCSRCFAIAHVCYPTLILNIIVRYDVLSFVLLMFRHLYHFLCSYLADCFYHLICLLFYLMFCHLDSFCCLN